MFYFKYLLDNAFNELTEAAKAYALKQSGSEQHNDFAAKQTTLMEEAIVRILQVEVVDKNWKKFKTDIQTILTQYRVEAEKKLDKALAADKTLNLCYYDRFSSGLVNLFDELERLFKRHSLINHKHEDHSKYISNPSLFRMFVHVCAQYKIDKIIEYKVRLDEAKPSHTTTDKLLNLLRTLDAWHDELSKTDKAPEEQEAIILSTKVKAVIDGFFRREDELQYQGRKGFLQAAFRRGGTFLGKKLGHNIGGYLGELLKPFIAKYNAIEQYPWEALPVSAKQFEEQFYESRRLSTTPSMSSLHS